MSVRENDAFPDVEGLLRPCRVAVVGASETSYYGSRLCKNVIATGGELYPVNEKYDKIFGFRCFPKLSNIPNNLDQVAIAVPAKNVLDILEQCIQIRVNYVTIISDGFAEASIEGKKLQEEITNKALREHLTMCGPNCMGFVNSRGVSVYGGPTLELTQGHVSVVSQSGGLLTTVLRTDAMRGIGISYCVSCGNEAVIECTHFIHYLLNQDLNTRVVGCILETIRNVKDFNRVAEEAVAKRIPIVVLKVGRSKKGMQAALSHTGAMAGSYELWRSLFKQKGIINVESLTQLVEAVTLLSRFNYTRGNRVCCLDVSGAESALQADMAEECSLAIPDYPSHLKIQLQNLMKTEKIGNPLDISPVSQKGETLTKILNLLGSSELFDIFCSFLLPDDMMPYKNFLDIVSETIRRTQKPFVLFTRLNEVNQPKRTDIPILIEAKTMFSVIRLLNDYSRFCDRARTAISSRTADPNKIREILEHAEGTVLTDIFAKRLLSEYGFNIVREGLALSIDEAIRIANEIGYPVALKVMSPNILHKTELGGMRLNIQNDTELRTAYNTTIKAIKANHPHASIQGVVIQEMVSGGTETILGARQDDQLGLAIMFGLGGIFTEVLRDISIKLMPISREDVHDMLSELRSSPLLHGYRGMMKADLNAIQEDIEKFASLCEDLKDRISEIDINPLLVSEAGTKVIDSRIILRLFKFQDSKNIT